MKWRVGFFLLLSFLFACHSKYDNYHLTIFKYNESNGISTLDPAFSKDKATIWATSQLFSSLVKMNDNLEVIPLVAKKWDISEDGLAVLVEVDPEMARIAPAFQKRRLDTPFETFGYDEIGLIGRPSSRSPTGGKSNTQPKAKQETNLDKAD